MKKVIGILASTFVLVVSAHAQTWTDDFEAAKKSAGEKKQSIMALFTGSDWCIWCKRLDAEVFSQPEFANFVADKYVLFKADFPDQIQLPEKVQAQNKALMERYGVEGFPTVLILDADGKQLQKTGYVKGGPKAFIDSLAVTPSPDKTKDGDSK